MSRRQVGIILLAVGVSACADAGHPDQDPSDLDAGVTQDFGVSDQGTNDAEREDLGVADVMSDVGLPDSGVAVDVGGSGTLLATAVTAGRESSCAVFRGAAWCWGSNPGGALGAGTPGVTASAPQRLIEEGWTELDRDGDHSCGLRAGVPWCMGANRDGALGLGDQGDRHRPTMLAGTAWTRISAGAFHTCGIRAGSLYCWGLDSRGQAGQGASSAGLVLSPAQVGTENDWSEVSAGGTFTCGIRAGSVYCFGDNSEGQLGRGHSRNEVENLVPMPISGVNYHGLSCGARHACALSGTALYCWGDHLSGQLGVGGDPSDRTSPTLVGSGWTWVSAGEDHTCGLQQAALYCWGNGLFGRLGNGRADQPRVPAPILVEAEGWQAVAAGGTHSCGIRDGVVFCWGSDLQGQAGLGGAGIFATPTEVRTR